MASTKEDTGATSQKKLGELDWKYAESPFDANTLAILRTIAACARGEESLLMLDTRKTFGSTIWDTMVVLAIKKVLGDLIKNLPDKSFKNPTIRKGVCIIVGFIDPDMSKITKYFDSPDGLNTFLESANADKLLKFKNSLGKLPDYLLKELQIQTGKRASGKKFILQYNNSLRNAKKAVDDFITACEKGEGLDRFLNDQKCEIEIPMAVVIYKVYKQLLDDDTAHSYEMVVGLTKLINAIEANDKYDLSAVKTVDKKKKLSLEEIALNNKSIKTLVDDLRNALDHIKEACDYNIHAQSTEYAETLHTTVFSGIIKAASIGPRRAQAELFKLLMQNKDGICITSSQAIGSGKTVAGVIAALTTQKYLGKALMFTCLVPTVRSEATRIAANLGIPFAVVTMTPGKSEPTIRIWFGAGNKDPVLFICDVESTNYLLKEDRDKYVLFYDEHTYGADEKNSNPINMLVNMPFPPHTIYCSATQPRPDKVKLFFDEYDKLNHKKNVMSGEVKYYPHVELISNDTQYGVNIIGGGGKVFLPHNNCKNKQQLLEVIQTIRDTDVIVRVYTVPRTMKIYSMMADLGVSDLPDPYAYFSIIDNFKQNKVAEFAYELLDVLATCSDDIIEKVCAVTYDAPVNDAVNDAVSDDGNDTDDSDIVFGDDDTVVGTDFSYSSKELLEDFKLRENTVVLIAYPDQVPGENLQDIHHDARVLAAENRQRLPGYNIEAGVAEFEKKRAAHHKQVQKAEKGKDTKKAKKANMESDSRNKNKAKETTRDEKNMEISEALSEMPIFEIPRVLRCGKLIPDVRYLDIIGDHGDDLELLEMLHMGIGILCPSMFSPEYTNAVVNMLSMGGIKFLFSDSSIFYGTNVRITDIIIPFALDRLSIQSIWQLIGRTGRVGKSTTGTIHICDDIWDRLMDECLGKRDERCAENINFAVAKMNHEKAQGEADQDALIDAELAKLEAKYAQSLTTVSAVVDVDAVTEEPERVFKGDNKKSPADMDTWERGMQPSRSRVGRNAAHVTSKKGVYVPPQRRR